MRGLEQSIAAETINFAVGCQPQLNVQIWQSFRVPQIQVLPQVRWDLSSVRLDGPGHTFHYVNRNIWIAGEDTISLRKGTNVHTTRLPCMHWNSGTNHPGLHVPCLELLVHHIQLL